MQSCLENKNKRRLIRNETTAYGEEKEDGERNMPEVFGGFGGDVGEELHLDAAGGDGTDGDVEEDDWVLGVRGTHVPLHASSSSA